MVREPAIPTFTFVCFSNSSIFLNPDHAQGYIVAHINELQALVIVEHTSGQYNLYLSDITGVYFALSLANIVVTGRGIDLELVSS